MAASACLHRVCRFAPQILISSRQYGVANKQPNFHTDVELKSDGSNNIPNLHISDAPKAVIFDKNGTLIDFHSRWTPWIHELTDRLEEWTGLELRDRVFEELDFCRFTNKTRDGVLGNGTSRQIKDELEGVLEDVGMTEEQSKSIVEQCWQECMVSNGNIKAEPYLSATLTQFKNAGLQIGICTSDTRAATERTLKHLKISHLIQEMVCGDDKDILPKPSGKALQTLCKRLNVLPSQAVMIGDTSADMEMGMSAGTGLNIGVLSGIGSRLNLSPLSDLLVDSIEDLPSVILDSPAWQEKQHRRKQGPNVQRISSKDDGTPKRKASLVIFDKDGTLICFHSMFTPWAEALIQRLESETHLELRKPIFDALGYDTKKKKWRSGIFAEGTVGQNQDVIVNTLVEEGLSEDKARDVMLRTWEHANHSDTEDLNIMDDPRAIFRTLKNNGVKVAICTADSRASTEQFLETAGLNEYVDTIVCGDDPDSVPKPSASNGKLICRRLGVDPEEAVVIGDTVADLGMGRSAGLGATVGVLSGVGEVSELDPQADHIVPSIEHVIPIVLDQERYDLYEEHKH